MATIEERKVGTRKGSTGHAERFYMLKGPATEAAAVALILSRPDVVPVTVVSASGIAMQRADSEIYVDEIGTNLWYGQVQWKLFDTGTQPADSFSISFDISTQSLHITQSRATVAKYGAGGAHGEPRDFKGAIGVNEDGSIDGCDIQIPIMGFQLNYTKAASFVSDGYIQTLLAIVGAVNIDVFHNFQPGTLLLTKVVGQRRPDASSAGYVWDLQYSFGVSENETDLKIGDITGIQKKGWEYLWVYYKTMAQQAGGSGTTYTVKRPVNAYVEEVFKKRGYSALGI